MYWAFVILLLFATCVFLFIRGRKEREFRECERRYREIYDNRKERNVWGREQLYSVVNSNRGTPAERDLILRLLKAGVSPRTIFHDLYVEKSDGRFSQIDLVVATSAGIVVFEVKDYSGWIFGNGRHEQWTQVLAYGREKHRFYNPIMQNGRHIKELRKQLWQFEKIPFFSVIVFDGNCDLRNVSFIPRGTFIVKPWRVMDVLNLIVNDNAPAVYADKAGVVEVLSRAVRNGESMRIQSQHIDNIKDMLGKERVFN